MTGVPRWRSQGVAAAAGGQGEEEPGGVAAVLTGQRWNSRWG